MISKHKWKIKDGSLILILLASQPLYIKSNFLQGRKMHHILSSDSPFVFSLMPVDREQFVLCDTRLSASQHRSVPCLTWQLAIFAALLVPHLSLAVSLINKLVQNLHCMLVGQMCVHVRVWVGRGSSWLQTALWNSWPVVVKATSLHWQPLSCSPQQMTDCFDLASLSFFFFFFTSWFFN